MQNILRAAFFTPSHYICHSGAKQLKWGLNLAGVGAPGIGKTQQTMRLVEECGLHGELIILSLKDPTEMAGLPVPDEHGKLRYIPGPKMSALIESKRGVGILDEFNSAAMSTIAASLTTVQDNLAGDVEIPGGIRWIVMMNPTEIAANGRDMPPPMANRFGWLDMDTPNASDWGQWLMGLGGTEGDDLKAMNAEQEEARVLNEWTKPFAMARGLVSAFIKANPGKLFMMPEVHDPKASKAWPSPRTWEMVTRALASSQIHNLTQVEKETFVSAFVGKSAANEFFTYETKADLPDPEDLLKGKVPFKVDTKRLDRMFAIFNSCTAFVTSKQTKDKKKLAAKLWEFCEQAMDRPDLVMDPATALVKAKLLVGPAAVKVLKKINPVLVSTGQIPSES